MNIKVEILPAKRWWKRAKFRVLEVIQIAGYEVPINFLCDGASVPWLFRLLFPVIGADYQAATFLHDYLLWLYKGDRAKARKGFSKALKELDINKAKAFVLVSAVFVNDLIKKILPSN